MTSRIMIVDDEQAIRDSLQGLFEDEEYLVVCAASGEDRGQVRRPLSPQRRAHGDQDRHDGHHRIEPLGDARRAAELSSR